MIFGLIIILILTLILPFAIKKIEHNLEFFLFFMGVSSVIVSGVISEELIFGILKNHFLYMISGAVLIAGLLFKVLKNKIKNIVNGILKHISLKLFVFLMIVILGELSSIITAIIAALILVEIINVLPIERVKKIEVTIVSCFSIGLGAAMTPIGEPIATIVVSKLNVGFWFITHEIGLYTIIGILILGVIGMWFIEDKSLKNLFQISRKNIVDRELDEYFGYENFEVDEDTYLGIAYRTLKIFIFIIALELLGAGFKPIIDTYVVKFNTTVLYWGNMISAVLDNATLAAAEISSKMSQEQVRAVLMGLLISGGILVPGNIPNIVSASKLKIKSSEWVRIGIPIGLILLSLFYIIIFLF